MHLSFPRKGVVLISVPLLFLLAFVAFAAWIQTKNEQATSMSLHSAEVITHCESLLRRLVDAETSMRGFVITGNELFSARYEQSVRAFPELASRLEELVADNLSQQKQAREIYAKAQRKLEDMSLVERLLLQGRRSEAIEHVSTGVGKRLMDEFRAAVEEFLNEERSLEAKRRSAMKQVWATFSAALNFGVVLAILLTVGLAIAFNRQVSRRLVRLIDTVQRFGEGRELGPPIGGHDEISKLDEAFRQMAASLAEARRKEQALVNHSLDVICSIDRSGRFVQVSPASLGVWGYSPQELAGRPYIELVVEEDVEKTKRAAAEILDGKVVKGFENRYRHKEGYLVENLWSAFWSEPDQLMYCVARDIGERKRAEEALARSAAEIYDLYNRAPCGYHSLDADGVFVSINDTELGWLGYERGELVGKLRFADVITPESREIFRRNFPAFKERGLLKDVEFDMVRKDGSLLPVSVSATAIFDEQGQFVRSRSTVFDISERRSSHQALERANQELELRVRERTAELSAANEQLQSELRERRRAELLLQESEQKVAGIIASAMDAIITVNSSQKITLFNAAAEQMFGCPASEALGQRLDRFIPERYRQKHREHIQDFGRTQVTRRAMGALGELRGLRCNGEEFPIEASISQIEVGGEKLFTAIVRDETERQRAENEIRQLNAELEQRVMNRTAALEAANKELESFSYSVSHDLRAPLRTIAGFSQALLEDYRDRLDVDACDYLDRICAAARRMGFLIDDLLRLSRISRSPLELRRVDLSKLAARLAEELKQTDPARQVEFVIAPGLEITGDPHLIGLALENLMGNAWKFTSKVPRARIEFGWTEAANGSGAFYVRDNGAGFDMAYAGKLFGAFQRLHGLDEFEGTGIGLATVQRIVRRHGGRVWAEGKVSEGATFYFAL